MAMADLMVKLGLDGSRFQTGIKNATQGVENFGDRWAGTKRKIDRALKLGGLLAMTAAVSKIITKFQELKTIGEEQRAAKWEILDEKQITNIQRATTAIDELKTRFKAAWGNLLESSGIAGLVTGLSDALYYIDQITIKNKSLKEAGEDTRKRAALRMTPDAEEAQKKGAEAKKARLAREKTELAKAAEDEYEASVKEFEDEARAILDAAKTANDKTVDAFNQSTDMQIAKIETAEVEDKIAMAGLDFLKEKGKGQESQLDALLGEQQNVMGSFSPANAMQEVGLMMGSADKNAAVNKLEELVRINEDIRTLLQGNTPGGLE